MGYDFNDDYGNQAPFITSAIDLDEMRTPVKVSSERSEDDRKKGSDSYHGV